MEGFKSIQQFRGTIKLIILKEKTLLKFYSVIARPLNLRESD
jgi:hypothetical protein